MAEDRKLPSTAGANEIDAFVRAVEGLPAHPTPGSPGRVCLGIEGSSRPAMAAFWIAMNCPESKLSFTLP